MGGGKEDHGIAHIVAVNMGYGHERAAAALRELSVDGEVVLANDYPGIPREDKSSWATAQRWYERVSRFRAAPLVGRLAFSLFDELQRIPEFYPRRDLSRPSLQTRELYALLRSRSWGAHFVKWLARNPVPIVSTYFLPAFAAEEHGYPGDIYILVCDADMARAWVAENPRKSRIRYFAPTGRVVERLKLYGVPEKNIIFTGFPLPDSAVGGRDATEAKRNLARRLCNLDPAGIFFSHTEHMIETALGPSFCTMTKANRPSPITLTFAVGGAGAQRNLAPIILRSLAPRIRAGELRLNLVAGTHRDVADYFALSVAEAGLSITGSHAVKIIYQESRAEHFTRFASLMSETDVLWTKPSELSFYTGLGLPIIMTEPVGCQEEFNRRWLQQIGGGVDMLDPRYVNEWLFDWVKNGALARMAWQGYVEAPTHGAHRIADVLRGKGNTMHELPLVV